MARYKPYDVNQVTLIPISFPDQILPGSFEYALSEIVDEHIDLRFFEARYQNDETGCLAYDPAILLKIVLFGYDKGLISSRRLADACQRNVQFKALTADSQPHFTTRNGRRCFRFAQHPRLFLWVPGRFQVLRCGSAIYRTSHEP